METAPFLNGKGLFAPYAPLCSYCPGLVALDNPQRHPASVEHRPEGACLQQRAFFWGPPQTEACDSANTQRRSVRQIAARMGMFLRHCEVVISPKRGWPVLIMPPVSSSTSSCRADRPLSPLSSCRLLPPSLYKKTSLIFNSPPCIFAVTVIPTVRRRPRPLPLQPTVAGSLSQRIKPRQRDKDVQILSFSHICVFQTERSR